MKRIVILLIGALFASVSLAQAQKDVTQFLGIPVDGFKPEMIRKLKNKGFTISPLNKDVLEGEFNGTEVNIGVVTNNNKVCRIAVSDVNTMNEADIRIRFNNLCQQFKNNKNYMPSPDYTIPKDEDISYGMSVDNKRYEAAFCQRPVEMDSTTLAKEIQDVLLTKYTAEQISNPTEEEQKGMIEARLSYMAERYLKKYVWFIINELHGEYYITMFYDNEYNRASGEDL